MHTTRHINAPAPTVFEAIANPDTFAQIVPEIDRIEHIGDTRRTVGARFRETRTVRNRTATVEFEVTEYDPDQRIRLVADAGGTTWDSLFTVQPESPHASVLTLHMDARPHTLAARIITPLLRGVIRKAIAKDMDAVKAWCERA